MGLAAVILVTWLALVLPLWMIIGRAAAHALGADDDAAATAPDRAGAPVPLPRAPRPVTVLHPRPSADSTS